ncbi:MAG: polysaccharide biosynthesis tyrosine autokinase [Vicinamibacterales bacterium]|nr:polysaccharide biosynthesis tyrosine autokinase [Vicinamibacterales bacterium]
MQPAPLSPIGARQVHLFDRLAVVVKYYKIVFVVFVLVVAGMMYQTYTTVPMYLAEARIHIEEEHTAETNIKEPYIAYTDPEAYYQTQYKILAGRDLTSRAARRLNLQYVPEFNGTGATPTRLSRLTQGISARLRSPLSNRAPAAPAPAGDIAIDQLVDSMLPRITVTPVRGSRLVDLAFTSADPEFAAKAANILAEEYVAQNLEFRLQNSDKTLQFLEAEVERQARVVQESEQKLAEYREDRDAGSLDDRQNIVISRLNQVNEAVSRARTQRVQREALYRQISAATDRESLTAIVQNPLVQSLKARLAELERERARLSERYGDKHPEIQRVGSQIVDTQRQVELEVDKTADSIKNDYEAALAEERTLTQDLEAQKTAALDLNRKSIDYSVLQRQAESNRSIYDSLLQRAKEFNVINNSRANNVRVLDRAQVPGGPFTPDIRGGWMMAMLFGIGLGVVAAFAIDYLDDTIKTPEDITWRLKLQFLGLVPRVRGDRHPLLSGPVPHDFGEAFRALRTALIMSSSERGTRIQVFTSAQPLEGKTTTAVNVALALAIGGARVLLIDADMRRPSLHKALRLPNDKGLSELLTGQARMRDVVQRSPDSNLLVITAGATPPNPSELLGSDAMRTFIQQLGVGPFDWVIIDTPPILAVTDAVILAPVVSGVTFVLGAEMTRWRLAERAIDTLQAGRPKSVSAVLNRVDFERNRYYYARYYGQQFQSYYAETPAAS